MQEESLSEYDRLRISRAKDYLRSVRSARQRLDQMQIRRADQLFAMQVKGMQYTGLPASPNSYGDAVPDGVAKLDVIDAAISDASAQWEASIAECLAALCAMPTPEYSMLIEHRYINGSMWRDVAAALDRSVSWCTHSEGEALIELYEFLPHSHRLPRHPAV